VRASAFFNLDKSDGYRERSDFRVHQGTVKLGFDLGERATLDFKGGYSSDRSESPGVLSYAQMDFLGRRAAQPGTDDNFNKARAYNVDGALRVFLAEDVTWKTTAWYDARHDQGQLGNPFFEFDSDSETQAVGTNNQLEIRRPILGHANQLVVGGDWLYEKVARDTVFKDLFFMGPDSPSKSRVTRTTYGFFIQDDFSIIEDLILSAGVRYDRNSRDGDDPLAGTEIDDDNSAWAPRAALTWRPLEPLSVYGSWSRGYRFPNVNETFDFFGLTPALDAEKSETWEIGAKWRNQYADANLAFYHMNVRDEIFANPLVSPSLLPTSVNLDRVRHRGVEFSAALRPAEWVEVYGSYTYDDVEIRRDRLTMLEGRRIPMVPRHRGTAGIRLFGPCETQVGMIGYHHPVESVTLEPEPHAIRPCRHARPVLRWMYGGRYEQIPQADDDAAEAYWVKCPIESPMAFDHNDMIMKAYLKLLEAGKIPAF
jgi:outer membrane receptor protein involved in Fe transport